MRPPPVLRPYAGERHEFQPRPQDEGTWDWVGDTEWFWDSPSWEGWAQVSGCPELRALEQYALEVGGG